MSFRIAPGELSAEPDPTPPKSTRLLAAFVDWTLAAVLPLLVVPALVRALGPGGAWTDAVSTSILAVVVVTYFGVGVRRGGTPGMRAAHIAVADVKRRRRRDVPRRRCAVPPQR